MEPYLKPPQTTPQPWQNLVEPWWNPGRTLVERSWNLTSNHPGPPRSPRRTWWNPGGTLVEPKTERGRPRYKITPVSPSCSDRRPPAHPVAAATGVQLHRHRPLQAGGGGVVGLLVSPVAQCCSQRQPSFGEGLAFKVNQLKKDADSFFAHGHWASEVCGKRSNTSVVRPFCLTTHRFFRV